LPIILFSLGINLDQLKTIVNTEIDRLPRATGSQLAVDQAFEQFISACQKQAQELGDTYVSLESFLLQFATSNSYRHQFVTFLCK